MIFILGSPDPEMQHIEEILRQKGLKFYYAWRTKPFSRATSSTAYRDVDSIYDETSKYLISDVNDPRLLNKQIVMIECHVPFINRENCIIIDHHSEGDPGYDKTPSEYWEGSSIGQFCNLLEIEPTSKLRLIAAADHCLTAAYAGECEGVLPEDLFQWRVEYRSSFKGITETQLISDIKTAVSEILNAKTLNIQGVEVADFTYHLPPVEVSEGCIIANKPVIIMGFDKATGRYKFNILGGTPEFVQTWMTTMAIKLGLEDIYGVPMRGYAGGYRDFAY